jgi:hypothetical protein
MAASTRTLRLSRRAHEKARQLAAATGKPMAQFVEDLLIAEEERMFWQRYRAALAARTPAQIAEDQAETRVWENALADGLDVEDWSDHDPSLR